MSNSPSAPAYQQMLNKVPQVTLYFWIIKVLCTTVGETAADYLSSDLKLGLTNTTFITGALLVAALVTQFRSRKYYPAIYWIVVVLLSVVGTQVTDNLVDNMGVSLETTTTIFGAALIATFVGWYITEKTLSIHTIITARREGFYWLAILFTFALGTAAGDLLAEQLQLGYFNSALIFGGGIAAITAPYYYLRRSPVLAFWLAYILTRPLGASIGDLLSQARDSGGIGLGTTLTSALFLSAILVLVIYLSFSRSDELRGDVVANELAAEKET